MCKILPFYSFLTSLLPSFLPSFLPSVLKRSHLRRHEKVVETYSDAEEAAAVKQTDDQSSPVAAKEEKVDEESESEEFESEEDEEPEKPKFTKKLVDVEVIEGSAARMEVVVDG